MPREPETYRLNIEQLNTRYPEKEVFSRKDLIDMTGMDYKTIAKHFPFPGRYISKVNLAWLMSKKGAPCT